jgi:arylformamidase
MNIQLKIAGKDYRADLSKQQSIAITLLPNGEQPSHFGVAACTSETIIEGDFIGDTKRGGSCNCNTLTITPHCNGTHTESISHVVNQSISVFDSIESSTFACALVSITPQVASDCTESYQPFMDSSNQVITRSQLELVLDKYSNEQLVGLAIRTQPNISAKKSMVYNSDNYPVYLTNDAMQYIVEREVNHLMVDFPSVDKMYDDGKLSNHRLFWNIIADDKNLNSQSNLNKTITEMIFADSSISDGFYLCNLQVPEIATDAVPSRPILTALVESSQQ